MGEETEITEPIASENVVPAENERADEPTKDQKRKRKKHLYKSLRELMEFYMGDVNLSKDRFISQRIQGQPFVFVDLSLFLTFNKVRALTSRVEDIAKALSQSELLQVSDDGTQICRKTPILKKENEDDCTIYVEQLGPDVDHDLLTKVFSEFGPVDYISMPRFSHNGKFKGFAFVEFKDPESAKKALEVLSAKGCCLSPHMVPDKLMSIKNFDSNKENNEMDKIKSETKPKVENQSGSEETKFENPDGSKEENPKKEKKKRKISEENDKVCSKKVKRNQSTEAEGELEDSINSKEKKDHVSKKENEDCKQDNSEKPTVDVIANKKSKSKKKDKSSNVGREITEQLVTDNHSEGLGTDEDKSNDKPKKRKHSIESTNENSLLVKCDEESNLEPETKKLKSDTEGGTDIETSHSEADAEQETTKEKKKRKKRKKVKKEKPSAYSLGLRVLSKREWKQLRNKYLNMQRDKMRLLKQHLSHSQPWEKQKTEEKEKAVKSEDKLTPGTVIKVVLEEPVTNCRLAKSEMRLHPEIRYIDVTDGSPCVYLRTATPEVAATLIQAKHWQNMEIIQGEEEIEYSKKMKIDREEHFKKTKPNQRGRTKLLKRAEQFQGKHITTFET